MLSTLSLVQRYPPIYVPVPPHSSPDPSVTLIIMARIFFLVSCLIVLLFPGALSFSTTKLIFINRKAIVSPFLIARRVGVVAAIVIAYVSYWLIPHYISGRDVFQGFGARALVTFICISTIVATSVIVGFLSTLDADKTDWMDLCFGFICLLFVVVLGLGLVYGFSWLAGALLSAAGQYGASF